VFVPVQLIGVKGGWGGALCNFDFILIRLDTSLIYHSIAVPHDAHIYTPVNVNIQFHDTVTLFPGCWQHEIVIDSIKP
jgi:hypothetical protein